MSFKAVPHSLVIPHTKKFRNLVLFAHNIIRNSIACGIYYSNKSDQQPYQKAMKMRAFTWNYELAYLAKQIARTCDSKFQEHYCFQSVRFPKLGLMTDFARDHYNIRNNAYLNPHELITTIIKDWPANKAHTLNDNDPYNQ